MFSIYLTPDRRRKNLFVSLTVGETFRKIYPLPIKPVFVVESGIRVGQVKSFVITGKRTYD